MKVTILNSNAYGNLRRGKIFFYDHEYEVEALLAENFAAFLAESRACEPSDA